MSALARVVLVASPATRDVESVVAAAAEAVGKGDLAVWCRAKEASREELAAFVASVARAAPVQVLVGGADVATSVSVACVVPRAGVHVDGRALARGGVAEARRALGGEALVTAAAHDDDDVRRAARAGASAVLVSPIFATPGEGKATPRGAAALTNACRVLVEEGARARVAVVALGGVDATNAAACRDAGADGVAVARALAGAVHVAEATRALFEAISPGR